MKENQPFADLTSYLETEDFKGAAPACQELNEAQILLGRQVSFSEDQKLANLVSKD